MTNEPTEKRLEDVRKGQLIVMTPEEWNAEQRAVPVFTARERKVRPFGNAGIEKRKEHEDIQRQLMMLSPPKAAFMMSKPPQALEELKRKREIERQEKLWRQAEKNKAQKLADRLQRQLEEKMGFKRSPW